MTECTLDRVMQVVHLHDTMRRAGAFGGVWVVAVHGMAPVSITAINCAMDTQYSLLH